MIIIGTARYGGRRREHRTRKPLCQHLGCGQWATRTAWDRLCNVIDACPNPGHGRSMTP